MIPNENKGILNCLDALFSNPKSTFLVIENLFHCVNLRGIKFHLTMETIFMLIFSAKSGMFVIGKVDGLFVRLIVFTVSIHPAKCTPRLIGRRI